MLKLQATILSIILSCSLLYSQEMEPEDSLNNWSVESLTALSINQASFTNWITGGENSFAGSLLSKSFFDFKLGRLAWDNYLNISYGILRSEQFGWRKYEDRLELCSKFGYAANDNRKLFYSVMATFKSQFTKGFFYPNDSVAISKMMSPGFVTLSAGIDYKPASFFSLFIAPASGKFTFILDEDIANRGMFGNTPGVAIIDANDNIIGYSSQGEKVRVEFGATVIAQFRMELFKKVNLHSKLELFNNYVDQENRKYIDFNWETTIMFKVNDWIAIHLTLHTVYDHDIDIPDPSDVEPRKTKKAVQFREALGIQVNYRLKN